MVLELEVAFHSQDVSDSYAIENIRIDLSDEDKSNILKASEIVKDNKFISSVTIPVDSEVTFLNDEDEDITDNWKCDVLNYIVYDDTVYFYAQNKWHAGDQVESQSFSIDKLNGL